MKTSLVVAALFLLGYSLFLAVAPRPSVIRTQSQGQNNRYVLDKYLRDARAGIRHEVVLVGSSMTRRLDFDNLGTCVYNLGLDGGVALTGLDAIARLSTPPRLVLVEINVPQRTSISDTPYSASRVLGPYIPAFRVENVPINLAISYAYSWRNQGGERVVSEPVRASILATMRQDRSVLPTGVLDSTLNEYRRLTAELESKGSRVVFYELPVHAELEDSPRIRQIRSAFGRGFRDHVVIKYPQLSQGGTIRTLDGIHLDDGDAQVVGRNLRPFISPVCDASPGP